MWFVAEGGLSSTVQGITPLIIQSRRSAGLSTPVSLVRQTSNIIRSDEVCSFHFNVQGTVLNHISANKQEQIPHFPSVALLSCWSTLSQFFHFEGSALTQIFVQTFPHTMYIAVLVASLVEYSCAFSSASQKCAGYFGTPLCEDPTTTTSLLGRTDLAISYDKLEKISVRRRRWLS